MKSTKLTKKLIAVVSDRYDAKPMLDKEGQAVVKVGKKVMPLRLDGQVKSITSKDINYAERVTKDAKHALKDGILPERVYRSTHGQTKVATEWGKAWTDDEIAQVNKMRGQGFSMAMIALKLGRSIVSLESRKWTTPLAKTHAHIERNKGEVKAIALKMTKAITAK
jgi:hypothetical protein